MAALVPNGGWKANATTDPTFQPLSNCSMPNKGSANGKLAFGLQELPRSIHLFSRTGHAGRLLSALSACVSTARQGTRVPPLQDQGHLPANRLEVSERESSRPISAVVGTGSGCRSRLLGQIPESVLNRDQYICNQVHFLYAFDVAYKFHQLAFDVSQESFVGLYVHVIVLSGPRSHSIREHEIVLLNMSVGVYQDECKRFNTNGIDN
jgi:hypothetical protein